MLDLLINNAGVMARRAVTPSRGMTQFGVNHLGHMALTQALLPLMQSRPDPRVVTVTSGAQYFGTIRWTTPTGASATTAMGPTAKANSPT